MTIGIFKRNRCYINNMRKFLIVLFILQIAFLAFKKKGKEKHIYQDNLLKCIYETQNERLNGSYVSYYNNGAKKTEGTFENNYHIGLWSLWDTTGKLLMQRDYSDPFTFKRVYPKVPDDEPIKLLNTPKYLIKYNADGYIENFDIKNESIDWQEKAMRYITPQICPR